MKRLSTLFATVILFSFISTDALAAVMQSRVEVYQDYQPVNLSEINKTAKEELINAVSSSSNIPQELLEQAAEKSENDLSIVTYEFEPLPSEIFSEEYDRIVEERDNLKDAIISVSEGGSVRISLETRHSGERSLSLTGVSGCILPFYVPADANIDNLSDYNLVFWVYQYGTIFFPEETHLRVSLKDNNGNIIPGTERNIRNLELFNWKKQEISLGNISDINEVAAIEFSNKVNKKDSIYVDSIGLEHESEKEEEKDWWVGIKEWVTKRIAAVKQRDIKMFFGID